VDLKLTNRKAIISGANRGIGRSIALAYAAERHPPRSARPQQTRMHRARAGDRAEEPADQMRRRARRSRRAGITVNAIAPGSTRTRRWDELVSITARDHKLSEKDAEARLLSEVPLGIVIEPEDISDLAVFLASARARAISGTAINIDGGRTRSI